MSYVTMDRDQPADGSFVCKVLKGDRLRKVTLHVNDRIHGPGAILGRILSIQPRRRSFPKLVIAWQLPHPIRTGRHGPLKRSHSSSDIARTVVLDPDWKLRRPSEYLRK